ncbi:hypothetical protein C8Q80DRAFT_467328 [Daedaleopsis nitida]|nr:hypothetical protein C8Q80DRAFT_467328 [Daedaleopsis nitida]
MFQPFSTSSQSIVALRSRHREKAMSKFLRGGSDIHDMYGIQLSLLHWGVVQCACACVTLFLGISCMCRQDSARLPGRSTRRITSSRPARLELLLTVVTHDTDDRVLSCPLPCALSESWRMVTARCNIRSATGLLCSPNGLQFPTASRRISAHKSSRSVERIGIMEDRYPMEFNTAQLARSPSSYEDMRSRIARFTRPSSGGETW